MSKLSPLALPRFDAKALSRTVRTGEAHTEAPLPQSSFAPEPDPPEPDIDCAADPNPEAELQAPVVPELPPVDTGVLLASLEKSIAEIETSAFETCHQAIAEFFAAAFPRLNEAFLAEEIALAMQTMAPPQVTKLNVQVPSELEAAFQRTLQQSERLSEICEIQPFERHDEMIVNVDWNEGGLQFDMDQFLNSSLSRLSGRQSS